MSDQPIRGEPTPPPWICTTDRHNAGRLFIEQALEDSGRLIAVITTNTPEDYANAALICEAANGTLKTKGQP